MIIHLPEKKNLVSRIQIASDRNIFVSNVFYQLPHLQHLTTKFDDDSIGGKFSEYHEWPIRTKAKK